MAKKIVSRTILRGSDSSAAEQFLDRVKSGEVKSSNAEELKIDWNKFALPKRKDSEDRLLRIKEVAALLSVSRQVVYRYILDHHLSSVQLPSGGLRIKMSVVRQFIANLK